MVILLASVIAASTKWTRLAMGRDRFSQGHEAWLGLWAVVVVADAVEVTAANASGTAAATAVSTSRTVGAFGPVRLPRVSVMWASYPHF
jgi:hypothetical protein